MESIGGHSSRDTSVPSSIGLQAISRVDPSDQLIPAFARMRNTKPDYTVKVGIFRFDCVVRVTHYALPQELYTVQDVMKCNALPSIRGIIPPKNSFSRVVDLVEAPSKCVLAPSMSLRNHWVIFVYIRRSATGGSQQRWTAVGFCQGSQKTHDSLGTESSISGPIVRRDAGGKSCWTRRRSKWDPLPKCEFRIDSQPLW